MRSGDRLNQARAGRKTFSGRLHWLVMQIRRYMVITISSGTRLNYSDGLRYLSRLSAVNALIRVGVPCNEAAKFVAVEYIKMQPFYGTQRAGTSK